MSDRYKLSIRATLALPPIYLEGINRFLTKNYLKLKEIFQTISFILFIIQKSTTFYSSADFASNCVNTKKLGLNSLRYFASKVWNMVPLEIEV